ncbi:hypothetical protein HYDPIDRAFT_166242 [Hydnomerulius pinastri MD-312]|nr:hypothetical protein HYDPIDRAFT_166242 [Hydnomerulius pinastri MD-312]
MASKGRVYGHIPGYSVGSTFKSKDDLANAGVHVLRQAGIHGDASENGGAFSICLSGGYEDNVDRGEEIIYVGSGGQDEDGTQTADQSFDEPPNQALLATMQPGKKGFKMCTFKLRRLQEEGVAPLHARRKLERVQLNKMMKRARR